MKTILILTITLVLNLQNLFAGAPSVEMSEALVHDVKKTPTGFALIVSGDITIGRVKGLKADHAVLTQPFGNPVFYVHHREKYEKRLRSYIGKKITVQVWGDILTIEAGRVTKIHGGHVNPLYPTKEEHALNLREADTTNNKKPTKSANKSQ